MPVAATDRRHLLALEGLPQGEILTLLEVATSLREAASGRISPLDRLAGRVIGNLFFEDSTRTRHSFSLAAIRLGADTLDLTGRASSVSKGETLLDTARTIEAMGVDALVIRSREAGVPAMIAEAVECSVINAGDGRHEHPTQGLIDLLTLQQRWGDFTDHRIAIVGDIAASRVARSAVHGLTTLGTDVLLVGPSTLVPRTFEQIAAGPGRVTVGHDLDEILPQVDAIMMLRVQFERHSPGAIADDYRARYGLTQARASRLQPNAPILHPGPVNRGLEIDAEVADDPERSVILDQVANGVAVRMAVLSRCLAQR